MGTVKLKRLRRLADGVDGHFSWFQSGKLEARIDEDQVTQLAFVWRASADQRAPGEKGRLARAQTFQRVGEPLNGVTEVLQQGLAAAHSLQRGRQCGHQAANRRISRHRSEERLNLDQLSHDRLHVLGRSEEQSVVGPERSGVRPLDGAEQLRLGAQPLRKGSGGLLAELRGLPVDDHHDLGSSLRERVIERSLADSPHKIRRQQIVGVCRHRKVTDGVRGDREAVYDRQRRDDPRSINAEGDQPLDGRSTRAQRVGSGAHWIIGAPAHW